MRILLASGNAKKLREIRAALAPRGFEVLGPEDVGGLPEVVEDGDTFAANATKKARAGAEAAGELCLADDSGLEVDHLDGAPGVRSARFAGPDQNDAANNALLLEKLSGVPDAERGARFVCALSLVRPNGELVLEAAGEARGRILRAPRGDGDFGYDPLFLFTEEGFEVTGKTFAELDPDEKTRVSHRGRALVALCAALEQLPT